MTYTKSDLELLLKKEQEKNQDLKKLIDNFKALQRLIPICIKCKMIINEKGIWEEIEKYMQTNLNTSFSYTICPDCKKKQPLDTNN